jgi:outer membrane immunogenic protein
MDLDIALAESPWLCQRRICLEKDMKKLVLGAVTLAALGFTVPALAADLPVKAPVYAKAPAMVPMFNWERCYVGGHVGYGWGRSVLRLDASGDEAAINTSGWLGGGQVGCNWQPNRTFVVGVEGEIWWSGMSGSVATTGQRFTTGTLTSKNRWDADIALRLGMPVDRALIYVKGGGALGNFSYTHTLPWAADSTKWGWMVGAGIEYAFNNNWSAKIEYNYIDFGRSRLTPDFGGLAISSRETKNVVKLGVNYLFGGPVVAKY